MSSASELLDLLDAEDPVSPDPVDLRHRLNGLREGGSGSD